MDIKKIKLKEIPNHINMEKAIDKSTSMND